MKTHPNLARFRKLTAALLLAGGNSLTAADIFKAPNADDLGSTTSWVGGVLPADADVVVWDGSVPANTGAAFSQSASWRGLRIVANNPGQKIDSFFTGGSGVDLTLGAAGLDASAAAAGNTFLFDTPTITLRSRNSQTWSVAAGAIIETQGPLRRGLGDAAGGPPPVGNGFSGGSHVHFNLGAGAVVRLAGGLATYTGGTTGNTILPGATIGSGANLDFAAMNASREVVPLHSLTTVGIPNGSAVTTLPGAGTFQTVPLNNLVTAASPAMGSATSGQNLATVVNVVNQRQASGAPVTGFSLANGWQPQGLRFSVPRLGSSNSTIGYDPNVSSTYGDWVVNAPSGSATVTMPTGIMVTSGVGKSNVIIGGTGTWRIGNTPWLLSFHQHNTEADLIFNVTTISSTHTANSSVLKTGPGRVIVTSTYNHTVTNASIGGGLAIHGGVYQVGNNTATGNLPLGTIANHASLVFNRTGTLVVGNVITGSGSLTNNGSGDIQLSGVSDFTGAVNLNAGTVSLQGASALGNGGAINFAGGRLFFAAGVSPDLSSRSIGFAPGASVIDVGSNNVTFANPIGGGGAGGFTKAGAGRLTLGGANNYSGNTTISAGALEVVNTSGSATGTGAVSVGASGALTGTGSIAGAVGTGAGARIAPGVSGVGDLTVGGLTLASGSRLELEINPSGGNDRVLVQTSGALTINGGDVTLYQAGGTSPFSTPGTYDLIQYSGALQGAGVSALTVANAVAGFDYTFSAAAGKISLSVAQGAVLTNWSSTSGGGWGSGTWSNGLPSGNFIARFNTELAAPSTVTLDGDRAVAGLVFSSAQGYTLASGAPANSTLTINNGTRTASISVAAGSHTISAPVSLASPLAVSTDAGAALAFTGVVSGSSSLVKTGAGRLTLAAANTFSGPLTVNGGALAFTLPTSLGTAAPITLDGGALEYGAGNTADLSTRSLAFGPNGATIDTGANDVVYAQAIGGGGAGRLTKTGSGSLTLLAASTFTGGVRVAQGELSIGAVDRLGSGPIELEGGVLDTSASLTLPAGQAISLGAAGGTIAAAANTTVTLSGAIQNVPSAAGALTLSGPGTFVLGVSNLHTGGTTINAGASASYSAGVTPFGSAAITLANGNLTIPASTNIDANSLVISGSGGLRVGDLASIGAISGNGTLTVQTSAASGATARTVTFTGTHAGLSGEIVVAGNTFSRFNGSSNVGGSSVLYTIEAGSTLVRRSSAATVALGGLAGAGTLRGGQTTADTVNFQIGAKNLDTVFSGSIIDGDTQAGLESTRPVKARITKLGTGTLTLAGNSTYTSNTTIDAGALLVDGSIASVEPLTVNTAGALGGAGSIASPVSVAGTLRTNPTGLRRGTLALGSSLNLAVVNPETSTVTTRTRFDFGGTTAHRVVGVSVAGALTYGGQLDIAIPGATFNGNYPLFAPAVAPTGSFDSVRVLGAADAVTATLTNNGSGVFTGSNGAISYTFNSATGSLAISGASVPAGAPSAPSLSATAGNAQVGLSWTATGATYDVYRSTTSGSGHVLIADDIAAALYTDTGLINGTTYYYYVVAANDAGSSPASAQVSATPAAVVVNALQSWRQTHFGTTENSGGAADAFDFDNDGRTNLLEYAVGSNPTVADSGPGYTVATVGGQVRITFNRIDDPSLTYTVQGRGDLASGSWTTVVPAAGNNPINGFTGTQAGVLETESVTVVDPVVLGPSNPRRFVRLQVSY